MSIRPIDFNGMVQNTHEVAQAKTNEDNKPVIAQQQALVDVDKTQEQRSHSVNETSEDSENFHWGDKDGDGSGYQGNSAKKDATKDNRQKKSQIKDGVVYVKNSPQSFDITV